MAQYKGNQPEKKFSGWSRHRSIFPGRLHPSIFDANELNFRVRNGNGWILIAINTGFFLEVTLKTEQQMFHKNREGKALDRLVCAGFCITAFTPCTYQPLSLRGVLLVSNDGISYLEGGFTLRCFQRLSVPYLAAQPCHWRDNWCTRGTSIPVLSY